MSHPPREGDSFGRYEIVRVLGRGGMGVVYEARQPELDRSVALKVLSWDLAEDASFRERFVREATMLARLDSPHVIQVHESGVHEDQLYIATQLVAGGDLRTLIKETGSLHPAMALAVLADVCAGLADAHDVGLVHRDVKPGNVLVRRRGDDVHCYLCDFGIARSTDDTHTRTSGIIGTGSYMAPERHEGVPASEASDIYSAGCLLWATLTGAAPYPGGTDIEVAFRHLHDPVPQLEGDADWLVVVNHVLRRSMAKAPADRYPGASEMRTDLLRARARVPAGDAAGPDRAGDPDATLVVPPRPPAEPTTATAPGGGPAVEYPRHRRGLALSGVVVVLAAGVGGYRLLAGGGGEEPAVGTTAESAAAPGESGQARPSEDQTCWGGAVVATAADCARPRGRAGLASVFASLDAQCQPVEAPAIAGKAEVFTCRYGDYLMRYTRWEPEADRFGHYDRANPGATREEWLLDGELAGLQWTSFEAGDREPFQWSAAYFDAEYSVSVEGISAQARRTGMDRVRATPLDRIGLR
ncbi:serine/threonine-protein kinase [Nocardioides donggukensis]|uniref:non-specific serine/threonine protein kinase n=1 Tax=Nocardioides donggukensis TaxID=2774019 RepID=A0A927Q1Y0_9ACTN|nr:serine/threonine-protein kinase [Nocardioides donggukensis]MBD8869849.1 serine/threonine protein kinase [Nocardioides donggukensis]